METNQIEQNVLIETIRLRKAALVFRSTNHPLRQLMLQLLHKHQPMTVTELYVKLRLEQSVASQHLAILRKIGVVSTQREGKKVFYSVNYARLDEVTQHAKALILGN